MPPRAALLVPALLAGALVGGCGKGGEPTAPPSDARASDAAWPRPAWEPTEDEAWVFFAVLGEFPDERPPFSVERYRSDGPGRGFETRVFEGAQLASLVAAWTEGALADRLVARDPALLDALRSAPACLALDVRVPDAPDFDHLRDAFGLVTYFVDLGGVAVLDPLTLRAWSPAEWRAQVFEAGDSALRAQVALLWSVEDEAGALDQPVGAAAPAGLADDALLWIHSRGLRKFARPDLSLRGVPAARFDEAVGFLEALATTQIDGAVLPTGDRVRLPGHTQPLRCLPAGDPDDPEFNNVHLAIEW